MWNAYCREHLDHATDIGHPSEANDALYNRVLTHVLSPRFYAPDTPFCPMFFTVQGQVLVACSSHYPNKLDSNFVGASKKAA